MSLRFGTDGVRAVAGAELTPEYALALGRAAARVLGGAFVVGRDTRRSGPLLEAAFAAGLAAEGADVALLGVAPTPAVAHRAAATGRAGAVISASHNPFADNGIKLFAAGGMKLPDSIEADIEAELGRASARRGLALGRIEREPGDLGEYVDHLVDTVGEGALTGLRVVLDCANGAASALAGDVFGRAGAVVSLLHAEPDGANINDGCGATAPDDLRAAVVAAGADAGLALDGDADRCLAVDGTGALVDGDRLLAMAAIDRHRRGRLPSDTVVVTVMTNLGFRIAMTERGITVRETAVGDRYVLEALQDDGLALGGEQSGHLVFRDLATTGDGMLTGLQVLDIVRRRARPLAELAAEAMTPLPQVLRNVRLAGRRTSAEVVAALAPSIAAVEAELGGAGRVLARPSGTEPLVRIMVEAPSTAAAEDAAGRLAAAAQEAAGPVPA